MWQQVTGLRWDDVTAGSKADNVTGETLKQLYEGGNTSLNQIESSEQSLCSDRDPRVVTFEEIVRMSSICICISISAIQLITQEIN